MTFGNWNYCDQKAGVVISSNIEVEVSKKLFERISSFTEEQLETFVLRNTFQNNNRCIVPETLSWDIVDCDWYEPEEVA